MVEAVRSVRLETFDKAQASLKGNVLGKVDGMVARLVALDSAHAAGLKWLTSAGLSPGHDGPGLAAGHAWCGEFLEVSADMHGAEMRASAMILHLPDMSGGMTAHVREFKGGGSLAHLCFYLLWAV